MCQQLQEEKCFNIMKISEAFTEANLRLREFKLSLTQEEGLRMLKLVALLSKHQSSMGFLRQIEPSVRDLKDRVSDEDNCDVTYDDMEEFEVVNEYVKQVYSKELSFTAFLKETNAFCELKRRQDNGFNLENSLQLVFGKEKDFLEEKAKLLDIDRGAIKLIEGVNRQCVFEFGHDRLNNIRCLIRVHFEDKDVPVRIEEEELAEAKEKARAISDKLEGEEEADRKRALGNYIRIYNEFCQLKEREASLAE